MTESWEQLSTDAPELAAAIEQRLGANVHHILATIQADGSPRLSGTEIEITPIQLRLGMMPNSHKLDDVNRDPRVAIHTAPLDPDLADGDAKLAGSLRADGATQGQPGHAFVFDFHTASLVRVVGEQLEFTIWTRKDGVRTIRRS